MAVKVLHLYFRDGQDSLAWNILQVLYIIDEENLYQIPAELEIKPHVKRTAGFFPQISVQVDMKVAQEHYLGCF